MNFGLWFPTNKYNRLLGGFLNFKNKNDLECENHSKQ